MLRGTMDVSKPRRNLAGQYARKIMKGETALANPGLQNDYQLLVDGHAVYLQEFFGPKADFSLLTSLAHELEQHAGDGMINWSRHFKHENPDFSDTFKYIVKQISEYFSMDVVNQQFQHGVPKENTHKSGPRFSIIAWGRRRVINVRNGGRDEIGTRDEAEPVEDYGGGSSSGGGGGHKMVTNDDAPMVAAEKEKGADDAEEPVVTVEDIARMVESFVLREETQMKRREDAKTAARAASASGKGKRRGRQPSSEPGVLDGPARGGGGGSSFAAPKPKPKMRAKPIEAAYSDESSGEG
eukprot:gene13036-32258_t